MESEVGAAEQGCESASGIHGDFALRSTFDFGRELFFFPSFSAKNRRVMLIFMKDSRES